MSVYVPVVPVATEPLVAEAIVPDPSALSVQVAHGSEKVVY